jgi:hypothetical protein
LEAGSWESRLSAGNGSGQHRIPLFNAGFPQSLIEELSTGNKYTIAQCWGDHVSFAGVIQDRDYSFDDQRLTVTSTELRSAYMDSRMLFGVGSNPSGSTTAVVLTVTSKSHSGAARAVISAAMPSSDWNLPIDLPSDGSGSFSAAWQYEERLNWQDHLVQIEQDGSEIDFRPYIDGSGYLRWETRVASAITSGAATDLAAKAPGSRVTGLRVRDNYSRQVTGVRGYGKPGTVPKWQEYPPGGTPVSVRDVWVNFGDIPSNRLQAAVDAEFYPRVAATRQWSFGLNVFPMGPELAAPGRLLNLALYGDPFIADGKYATRVVSVRGDLSFNVRVEAQNA